jgi:uncharacterized protein involved in exopolysaccharide biosynthesis
MTKDHSVGRPTDRRESQGASEISLVEIANVLLRNRRLLVFLPLALGIGLGGLALTRDRSYVASAAFLPHTSTSAGGGAAAVARQLGLDVGSPSRPGQSPEFYAQLLKGRSLLRKTVESVYRFPGEGGRLRSGSLIELWRIEAHPLIPPWREAVSRLEGRLNATVDRQTGLVRVTVTAETPHLAEQIVVRLIDLLTEFNLETRQSQAREEARFVADRLEEAAADLRAAEDELQGFLRQNRQFEYSPELRFEHSRLERQVGMRQQIVNSLAQSLEQARIEGVRDTPVITIVDPPQESSVPIARGSVQRALLGLLLGLLLAVFIAFAREFARRSRDHDRDDYREFDRLKREAWSDVRRPHRILLPAGAGRRTRLNP